MHNSAGSASNAIKELLRQDKLHGEICNGKQQLFQLVLQVSVSKPIMTI